MSFLPVPAVAEAADDLLAAARSLVDAASTTLLADDALGVSCRAGCSACCSQAVPVTPAEVRSVVAAVGRLPDGRRTDVARRVTAVNDALTEAGISAATFTAAADDLDARRVVARRYLRLDLPCPLLFDGVCSVRADRPLACRQYLVTSDPVHCAPPGNTIDQVVRIRSRSDVLRGFAEVSRDFGERRHQILAFALAESRRNGPPAPPPAEPRSGPRMAAMLTPPAS